MIPFNKPYFTGKELQYISQAVQSGKISGDGMFTKRCHHFFHEHYGFKKVLLTTSCTDALEMAALLLNIQPGDEVIIPSFTFVSTANAFALRGARIVFADSSADNPNIDTSTIEALITNKTKAIVVVHYAGVAVNMDQVMQTADKHGLFVIEDAAQAIESFYNGKRLGSIGHLAAFSFHETKNIISGEGGLLVINDDRFVTRADIIWEKGTNRSAFFRGEVDKYSWIDLGSSFLPSDMIAAFLYAQLENLSLIQNRRLHLWNLYAEYLKELSEQKTISLPHIPSFAYNNAHMFYILCRSANDMKDLLGYLRTKNIYAVFHYQPLHLSSYFRNEVTTANLPNSARYAETLLRLPLFFELTESNVLMISDCIKEYYDQR